MTTHASHTLDQLQRRVAKAEAENARLLALMERKEAQWEATKAALFEQFRLAIERQFGPSTDKHRVEQADLLINEAEADVDEEDAIDDDDHVASSLDTEASTDTATAVNDPTPKRRTRGGRIALPPELPRIKVVHELPEGARHFMKTAPNSR